MTRERQWRRLLLRDPEAPAVTGPAGSLSRVELLEAALGLADTLTQAEVRHLALRSDNHAAWVVIDLAAAMAGIVLVPVPGFFTREQAEHALADAGVDAMLSDPGFGSETAERPRPLAVAGTELRLHRLRPGQAAELPAGTSKITYTSGTTGSPKGVCLSEELQWFVAEGLAHATAPLAIRRHLCLLPLPVLLENVAGLHAALVCGAEVCVPPLAALGWRGGAGLDPAQLSRVMQATRPDSIIVLPQVLVAIVDHLERTGLQWPSLKMVAVGGARTSTAVLERAERLGLPVFEGYGLSELGSVTSLNVPGTCRHGTVGRPLPGRAIRVHRSGEIEVSGPRFLGYTGHSDSREATGAWFATGDLGRVDADGFLQVAGRKDDRLITGYGRNINPEWLEAELLAEPGILQAIAVCPAWPLPGALIVSAPGTDIETAVDRCNHRLPDYARIGAWRPVPLMTPASGLLTANGRPRRRHIELAFRDDIETMSRTLAPVSTVADRADEPKGIAHR